MPSAPESRWQAALRVFLLLFAAALPHSLALAQLAGGAALLIWLRGLLLRLDRARGSPLDKPLLAFLLATAAAAVLSLEPAVSIDRLRSTALLLVVLLVANAVRSLDLAWKLALTLLLSAGVSAAFTVKKMITGEGVEVTRLARDSPLRSAGLRRGDIVLACDGQAIADPAAFDRILAAAAAQPLLRCRVLQAGVIPRQVFIPGQALRGSGREQLGYEVKVGRTARARGAYSHFVSYAEVLMQLTALGAGLWLASRARWSATGVALLLGVLLLATALAATFTRASWAALAVAVFAMISLRVNRRQRLVLALVAALALLGMNAALEAWRGTGFYNPRDLSSQYRLAMWREAGRLVQEYPVWGIGVDSIRLRYRELGVTAWDQFRLYSHFHSNPIQLGVERGLVGLAAWLWLMGACVWLAFRLARWTAGAADWRMHALALGIFGAVCGFQASGLVHYNFGDSEVVMLFWTLMGLAAALDRLAAEQPAA